MKRCPACKRVENDDTLAFCRADGTPLVSDSESVGADVGTIKLGAATKASEIETSVLPHTTGSTMNRATAPTTVLPAQQLPSTTLELTKPKRRVLIASVLLIAAVFMVGGY